MGEQVSLTPVLVRPEAHSMVAITINGALTRSNEPSGPITVAYNFEPDVTRLEQTNSSSVIKVEVTSQWGLAKTAYTLV
eukprot:223962-Prorocentrum_minimum.AAC.1